MTWVCEKCAKPKKSDHASLYGRCDKCKRNGWVKEVK